MEQKINHSSSDSARAVGIFFVVLGVLSIISGLIWAFAALLDDGVAWPGLVLAGSGIFNILIGNVIKSFSVVARAAESFLHNNGDGQFIIIDQENAEVTKKDESYTPPMGQINL